MPISFASAAPLDAKTTRVILTGAPLALSKAQSGDALNPETWAVTSVGPLQPGAALHVLAATLSGAAQVDVSTSEDLLPYPSILRIAAPTLRDSTGAVIVAPTSSDFPGLAPSGARPSATNPQAGPVDLRNLQAPSDSYGGTLVMTPAGDYAIESGSSLVKKLMLRRLLTDPGGFFHLPNYGVGLREKRLYTASRLVQVKKEVERQMLLEPEVEAVSATVTLDPNGILTIQLRARLRSSGVPLEATARVPLML